MKTALEMMWLIVQLVLCVGVVVVAICRVDALNPKDGTKPLWSLMYVCAAVMALGAGLEVLRTGPLHTYALAALCFAALNFFNTRAMWKSGIPESAIRHILRPRNRRSTDADRSAVGGVPL